MFDDVKVEQLHSAALSMTYHLTPWDQPAFPGNSAAISSLEVRNGQKAKEAFDVFRGWCASNQVKLVSCRLEQDRLTECAFLEANEFRFIELIFRPVLSKLSRFADDPEIAIEPARPADADEIAQIAARIFTTGRFIADPWIDTRIGQHRYRDWVLNAFHHPRQHVFKCVTAERIVAFFVIESLTAKFKTDLWTLFGVSPGVASRGLGRHSIGQRAMRAMLAFEHREGTKRVVASISSLNVAMIGLLASLDFFFPAATITLHWCPSGPVRLPSLGEG